MNTEKKLIAAAKRAARALARENTKSYQQCLDTIARAIGRPTWKAFLDDPVPVDDDAISASAEPDFGAIAPEDHAQSIIRYGRRIEALYFIARPHASLPETSALSYILNDESIWPVDGRGLSLENLAHACIPGIGFSEINTPCELGVYRDGQPVIDGTYMRSILRISPSDEHRSISVSASLDGSHPPDPDRLSPQPASQTHESEIPDLEPRPAKVDPNHHQRSLKDRIKRSLAVTLKGANQVKINDMVDRGIVNYDHGPKIGVDGRGRFLCLGKGRTLCAFSPPGTGRMAGITIPALLSDDAASCIVHDDGQLIETTSGWRSTLGPVHVIRLDGNTVDSLNPFGREWISPKHPESYVDFISQAIAPDDARVARLIGGKAMELVSHNGETTLRAVRDEIAATRDHPMALEALTILDPLVDPLGHAATSTSTFSPDMLRSRDAPSTVYIVRDPRRSTGSRDPLAAVIQEVLWMAGMDQVIDNEGPGMLRPLNTIINDFHRLPRIKALPIHLDMSRAYAMGYIIAGNSPASIPRRYLEDAKSVLAMLHLRMIPPQSHPDDLTLVDPERCIPWWRASRLDEGECIFTTGGAEPPTIKMPFFFRHQALLRRAWNPRSGKGYPPVPG